MFQVQAFGFGPVNKLPSLSIQSHGCLVRLGDGRSGPDGSRRACEQEDLLGPCGIYGVQQGKQRVHNDLECDLRGRWPVHMLWQEPQRDGQEPQRHLHTLRGG